MDIHRVLVMHAEPSVVELYVVGGQKFQRKPCTPDGQWTGNASRIRRHLIKEVVGDGEGGGGTGGWGVEEVDLVGLLLEGEIHEKGAVVVDGLGSDAAAALAGDVFHADFGDEALQVF